VARATECLTAALLFLAGLACADAQTRASHDFHHVEFVAYASCEGRPASFDHELRESLASLVDRTMRDFEMMPISHHPSLIAKEAPNIRIDSIYRWQGYAFFTWNENEASSMTMASDPPPLLQRLFLRRP
jgi:hypothetical protein